jgi:predicted DNA-binding protein with PD1-like motif
MKHSEGRVGRVFVVRLEDGDRMPEALERLAAEQGVHRGMCILVGGVGAGNLVVGPEDGEATPVTPMMHALAGIHEIAGVGTLIPTEDGRPRLHMHAALGREGKTRTGCIRPGVDIWKIGEVILLEILDNAARRVRDAETGFDLLEP